MSLLPRHREEFGQKEYWEGFFKKRGGKTFEWYGEYPELCNHLHKYVKTKDEILMAGCGNSNLSSDLFDIGYKKITNIDISQVVIRQMLNLHEKERPELKFLQMDVLHMEFPKDSFSVVIDKGTLDALMPNDDADTCSQIEQYFAQISSVLRVGGRYICVSLLQEHILKAILNYFPAHNYMFRVVRCPCAENPDSDHPMPVFMIICSKFLQLPRLILEANVYGGDKMQRLATLDDIHKLVAYCQRTAIVCAGLKHTNIADQEQIFFDLCRQGEDAPRYTINLVDLPPERQNKQYAAFIVPQGREVEWMFSTSKGRKYLASLTKYNRLAVVTLHRNQIYEHLDAIQSELNDPIKNLAPAKCSGKIPFLSLNSDVGERVFQCEGHSDLSGNYIVEDVAVDMQTKFRRLFYMDSQAVIQSEARLKPVKNRKGGIKYVIDHIYLTCRHHSYMCMETLFACEHKPDPSILVIGLGGGGLCMFLRQLIPKATITAVDIDKDMLNVARNWFGLKEDDQLKVVIDDGLKFVETTNRKGRKFDAILFDVDSKEASIGISCPPRSFLAKDTLERVKASLKSKGLFVLNLVIRDESLRPDILRDIKEVFATVATYQLEEDLNQVVVASPDTYEQELFIKHLREATTKYDQFAKSHKIQDDLIDTKIFLNNLFFV